MGRRRLYFTEEEKLAAQAENSRRYYGNNHEKIREAKRNSYSSKASQQSASQVPSERKSSRRHKEEQTREIRKHTSGSSSRASTSASAAAANTMRHRQAFSGGNAPSAAQQALSLSIPGQLSSLEERYRVQTRSMNRYAYLIKLTEVNMDEGQQPFVDELHEFERLGEDILEFETEVLQRLGAGVVLNNIINLAGRTRWMIGHLRPLCRPRESDPSREDMLQELKEKSQKENSEVV